MCPDTSRKAGLDGNALQTDTQPDPREPNQPGDSGVGAGGGQGGGDHGVAHKGNGKRDTGKGQAGRKY